jgi:peptidyl-prolyl cis-trans isomerase B (cyclophilin B)
MGYVSRLLLIAAVMTLASVADAAEHVKMETSMGDIVIELNRDKAPVTVDNFLKYVKSGFYNGTIFHRVIPNFMIQGGGFTPDMQKKPAQAPIKNEADNGLRNDRGTIAMARTGQPHSATAQFFINVVDNAPLNHTNKTARGWGYAVFGKVVEGMDTVDAIRQVRTGPFQHYRDVPIKPVIINKVSVIEPSK